MAQIGERVRSNRVCNNSQNNGYLTLKTRQGDGGIQNSSITHTFVLHAMLQTYHSYEHTYSIKQKNTVVITCNNFILSKLVFLTRKKVPNNTVFYLCIKYLQQ